jgi:hypothetical protein
MKLWEVGSGTSDSGTNGPANGWWAKDPAQEFEMSKRDRMHLHHHPKGTLLGACHVALRFLKFKNNCSQYL